SVSCLRSKMSSESSSALMAIDEVAVERTASAKIIELLGCGICAGSCCYAMESDKPGAYPSTDERFVILGLLRVIDHPADVDHDHRLIADDPGVVARRQPRHVAATMVHAHLAAFGGGCLVELRARIVGRD